MLSSETNPACLRVLSHRFPKLHHLGDVAKITFASLRAAFPNLSADVVVLGAGSPCNQISCAGNGQGLAGKDSRKFYHSLDVIDWLIEITDQLGMKLIIMFEMVVPAAISVVHEITEEFLVLVMRCIFGSCCTHFYDDHLALEPSIAQGSAQVRYRGLCSLLSVHLDESKHKKMKPNFLFIGCRFVLVSLFVAFGLTLSPKEGRVERVTRQIEQYLQIRRLTPAEACSLLSVCLYIAGQLQGRCTRLADSVLIRRQYSDQSTSIDHWIEFSLRFLLEASSSSSLLLPPSSLGSSYRRLVVSRDE